MGRNRMMDMSGEEFDRVSEPGAPGGGTEKHVGERRYLGIRFACCAVYARVYVNHEGTAYVGHCPKCGRRAELRIGPGGTDARFFTAY